MPPPEDLDRGNDGCGDVFLADQGLLPVQTARAAHVVVTRFEPELYVPPQPTDEVARASLVSVADWDSLATITLVSLLEEEFAIKVDPGDIEHLTSYELILDHLRGATRVP